MADIPGLIEGASDGAGLGHEFLAHIERTRLLVHVLDLSPLDDSDPQANYELVERELAQHDPRLAALPRILALSKADLVDEETRERAAREWAERGLPVVVTSAATGLGLTELSRLLLRSVPDEVPAVETPAETPRLARAQVFRPGGPGYEVRRPG